MHKILKNRTFKVMLNISSLLFCSCSLFFSIFQVSKKTAEEKECVSKCQNYKILVEELYKLSGCEDDLIVSKYKCPNLYLSDCMGEKCQEIYEECIKNCILKLK